MQERSPGSWLQLQPARRPLVPHHNLNMLLAPCRDGCSAPRWPPPLPAACRCRCRLTPRACAACLLQALKLAKKAAKRKQIKRGVKEVIKAIRKNVQG